jgi:hypothetical protein
MNVIIIMGLWQVEALADWIVSMNLSYVPIHSVATEQ